MIHNRGRPVRVKWSVTITTGTGRSWCTNVYATSEASARFRALDRCRAHGYDVVLSDITECKMV